MPRLDIIKVYTSVVKPVLEYACHFWHPGLTDYQVQQLESIQERAMRMVYPSLTYKDALSVTGLPTLALSRHDLYGGLFSGALDPFHKLFPLLPPPMDIIYNQRHAAKFTMPMFKTNSSKTVSFHIVCFI